MRMAAHRERTAGRLGRSTKALWALGFAALNMWACDSGGTKPERVASVTVRPPAASLVVGHSLQFDATLASATGGILMGRTVVWSSSAPGVASVSSNGLVTGLSAGPATIVAAAEGMKGIAVATVLPPVAVVVVSPTVTRLAPGDVQQFTALLFDAAGNTLTGRLVTWSSNDTSALSVNNATGVAIGVREGTWLVTATAEAKTASATVTVTPEPPGMTPITDWAFNCMIPALCGADWEYTEFGNGSVTTIVQDPTAPKSPPNVGQVSYPAGLPGGEGVGQVYRALGTFRTLYISTWIKFSSNWVGNASGNNKMLYLWMDGQIMLITEAGGAGNAPLWPTNFLLYLGASYPWYPDPFGSPYSSQFPSLDANLARPQIVRGQWHHYEYVVNVGTPGSANGTFEAWLDGAKTHNFARIMWRAAGAPANFSYIQWEPIWGGGTGTIAVPQYQYMDHIYISGK
jgi:hypothetical protein